MGEVGRSTGHYQTIKSIHQPTSNFSPNSLSRPEEEGIEASINLVCDDTDEKFRIMIACVSKSICKYHYFVRLLKKY